MAKTYISKRQLTKLQTLYAQAANGRDGACPVSTREARLAWASELAGRGIRSFNELTRKEAAKCIDFLHSESRPAGRGSPTLPGQPSAGRALSSAAADSRCKEREASDQARGTEGRKSKAEGGRATQVTMAGAEDLARIQDALTRLGWDQARFEAWLRSPTSPLGRKSNPQIRSSNPQIRTRGEANRVWWALKRLLKRAGAWNSERPAGGGRQADAAPGPEAA